MILVNFLSNLTLISQQSLINLGKSHLINLNNDLSRLTNFVNSRKDHDVVFTPRGITVTQVLSILKRVSPNKSAGIDGINVRLLRLAAPVITLSIARIIDYALSLSGVLLVDYCKAFDMVDHNLLLLKLEAYGFTNRAYNWLASHPDVLRGSSRVRGAGTRDEPLRSSAWEANNRPIRLTQSCTQFKPFGNKTFCFRNFHTFK